MAEFRINVTVDPTRAEVGSRRVRASLDRTAERANRLRAIMARAFAGIGGALVARSVVRTLANFGQAMSTVRAITQATGEQFGRLRDTARRLGAETRFSATQAAEGMLFLARAGFSTNQVLASVEGTLQLAQAGALDLGRAADIASNILTGFRLQAEETGRVVDVLALAANSSNTTVGQLGDAMKFVAPVAAGLGLQIETVAAAIGALSDAGLQASLAGTGLRRVLAELESPSTKTAGILRSLGLTTDDVRVSQVGLVAALQNLRDAGVDTGLALEIFGDRGGPAFEVLSTSIPKVRRMTGELQNAGGTAERVAAIMDDNLNGALLRVRSAAEAVVISFGDLGAESSLAQALNGLASALRSLAANMDLALTAATSLFIVIAGPRILAATRSWATLNGTIGAGTVALRAFRVAARFALRAIGVGFAIEAFGFVIGELERMNDIVRDTPATWGDAAVLAVDGFVNNLIGGLIAVGRLIPNLLRILTDPIVAGFSETGKIAAEMLFGGFRPEPQARTDADGYSRTFLQRVGDTFRVGIAPPEFNRGRTIAAAKRAIAYIERQFDGFDLPTLKVPEFSFPTLAEIRARFNRLFDFDLPTLSLPDISLPSFADIRDRIERAFDFDLPTLVLPDISVPSASDVVARIRRAFTGIELPTLTLPDFKLPTRAGLVRSIDRLLNPLSEIGLGINFELPTLAGIGASIRGLLDRLGVPTISLDFELPSLEDIGQRIRRLIDQLPIPDFLRGRSGGADDAQSFFPDAQNFGSAGAYPNAANFGSGERDTRTAAERIADAAVAAFNRALERIPSDFNADLNRTYVDLAGDERRERFRRPETPDAAFGIPQDLTRPRAQVAAEDAAARNAARLAQEQADSLRELRDQLDPVGAATREVAEAHELLSTAVRAGNITSEEAGRLGGLLAQAYRDQLDPLGAVNREISQDIAIRRVAIDQRGVEIELLRQEQVLRSQGVALTGAERSALRQRLADRADSAAAAQREEAAYRKLQDPVRAYREQLQALNDVLALHPELAGQAARAEEDLRLAFLDSQETLEAGFERGFIRATRSASNFAAGSERLVTNAFRSAEDAVANFATKGKLDFGSFADSILSDLTRLATAPITSGIGSLFSGLLGGIGGGGFSGAIPVGSGGGFGGLGFAPGGLARGPGTGTSDSILARISNGEFIVNARATRQHLGTLQAINTSVPAFQTGGLVGTPPAPRGRGGGEGRGTTVQIINQRGEDVTEADIERRPRGGPGGDDLIRITIRDTVRSGIEDGDFDGAMGRRFGSRAALP